MLEVTTGSRLHFGLLELAAGEPLRFGGLGLMLAAPGWTLRFSHAPLAAGALPTTPEVLERIERVRCRLAEFGRDASAVTVEVRRSLPLHSGLGSGTQLAAAVAFGFEHFLQNGGPGLSTIAGISGHLDASQISLERLIQLSGRGKRSGIGLYGFLNGGLILDEGYPADALVEQTSPRPLRAATCHLNPAWRIVLLIPHDASPITGTHESTLMDLVSQQPNPNRRRMRDLAQMAVHLSHSADGFEEFTAAVGEYVQLAGQLFSICQADIYNGAAVRSAVELAQQVGLRAVGQSSWGPAVFGFAPDEEFASTAARRLAALKPHERWGIHVATPASQSAHWKWITQG